MGADDLGAILLAGGRGSRMGGVHKPLLKIGGETLLDAALRAARDAQCDPIVVVGPADEAHADLTWIREEPPFGGPVAAILTALPSVDTPRVLVLACDLPRAPDVVRLLVRADAAADGVCLRDAGGRPQWLAGIYRTDALRAAATTIPDAGRNASVRSLLADLAIAAMAAADIAHDIASDLDIAFDIDTWDDLDEARRRSP